MMPTEWEWEVTEAEHGRGAYPSDTPTERQAEQERLASLCAVCGYPKSYVSHSEFSGLIAGFDTHDFTHEGST